MSKTYEIPHPPKWGKTKYLGNNENQSVRMGNFYRRGMPNEDTYPARWDVLFTRNAQRGIVRYAAKCKNITGGNGNLCKPKNAPIQKRRKAEMRYLKDGQIKIEHGAEIKRELDFKRIKIGYAYNGEKKTGEISLNVHTLLHIRNWR